MTGGGSHVRVVVLGEDIGEDDGRGNGERRRPPHGNAQREHAHIWGRRRHVTCVRLGNE